MNETLLWVGLVAAIPVLNVGYNQVTLFVAVKGFGYRYRHSDMFWFYAAFAVPAAVAVAALAPVAVPLGDTPVLVAGAAVGGVSLYRFDNGVWAWWKGASPSSPNASLASMLPALFVPIAEEYLYRGVLGALLLDSGPVAFAAVSAVAFGLNHYYLGRKEILFKTWDGAVYCGLYLWSGGILAPVAAHVGYNAAQVRFVTGEG